MSEQSLSRLPNGQMLNPTFMVKIGSQRISPFVCEEGVPEADF